MNETRYSIKKNLHFPTVTEGSEGTPAKTVMLSQYLTDLTMQREAVAKELMGA